MDRYRQIGLPFWLQSMSLPCPTRCVRFLHHLLYPQLDFSSPLTHTPAAVLQSPSSEDLPPYLVIYQLREAAELQL